MLLHHALYDNVDESICLSRKRDRFKAIADHYEHEGFEMRPPHRRRPIKGFSQQIKVANAALKKRLETYTGNTPLPRKAGDNLSPNLESAGAGVEVQAK